MSEHLNAVRGENMSAQFSGANSIERTKVMLDNTEDNYCDDVSTPAITEDVSSLARRQSSEDEDCNELHLFDFDIKKEVDYLTQVTNLRDEISEKENSFLREENFLHRSSIKRWQKRMF
eukprot:TRINITY_DN78549_c0_g1_i3.p3 TRINITY_DN78549_c0_g1~~TRINITY_DN78549_c0_g1_i3.p3  ORF type:complete len:119 (+),score=18.14 TRINITY_DN78549_c0_g1_i3:92-448(+)